MLAPNSSSDNYSCCQLSVCSCENVLPSFLHPPSCRGLTAISQMLCVKSTAQRELLYRYNVESLRVFSD